MSVYMLKRLKSALNRHDIPKTMGPIFPRSCSNGFAEAEQFCRSSKSTKRCGSGGFKDSKCPSSSRKKI